MDEGAGGEGSGGAGIFDRGRWEEFRGEKVGERVGGVEGMKIKMGNDKSRQHDGGRVWNSKGKTEYEVQGSFMRMDGTDGNHEKWTRENLKKEAQDR